MMHLCALWQDTGDGEIDIEIPEGVGPGDTFEVSLDTGGGGAADDGLDGLNIDALLQGGSDDEDEDEDEEEGPGVTMDMMVTCPEGTSAGQPILITTEWGADLEVVRGRQMTDWHTDPFRGPIRAVKRRSGLRTLIAATAQSKLRISRHQKRGGCSQHGG